jgi:hypothetical protein
LENERLIEARLQAIAEASSGRTDRQLNWRNWRRKPERFNQIEARLTIVGLLEDEGELRPMCSSTLSRQPFEAL